ncbi:MAG: ABC transporter permease [Methylobacterium sp.]|uniref:ABC transporter permease n=1 Tax=Methylobacterium sp. TaxID=409 RepID=UPI002721692B|nr:ABC transporter permease [Methylobacterium sp.]MDO9426461.1 ABC transporter permease [Methylobacterium sp.]
MSATAASPPASGPLALGRAAYAVLLPVAAILIAALAFALFVALYGRNPADVFATIYLGGFASTFAWQNTLSRAAPLILAGLAVAIPARAGMIIIGGEGALALGGLAAAATYLALPGPPPVVQAAMLLSAVLVGGLLIGLAGWLRQYRGINETISSLLLSYLALAVFHQLVEGPLRDPESLDKPATAPLAPEVMLTAIPGTDIHIGLALSVAVALLAFAFIRYTVWGFTLRVVGGSAKVGQMIGLPVNRWITGAAFAGGAMAGLAGAVEVAAVQGTASHSLIVGYGTSGILVAFLARQSPLAVIPVAILMGGLQASGSLLQRRLDLPDASILVFQGLLFVAVLVADALGQSFRDKTGGGR